MSSVPPPAGGAPAPGWFAYPPSPPPSPWSGCPLAGFGLRLGAFMVDSAVAQLFILPALIVFFVGPWRSQDCSFPDEPLCEVPTGGTIAVAVVLAVASMAASLAYYVLPVAKSGATLGVKLVGCRMIDLGTGRPPRRLKALGRHLLGAFISSNTLYIGHLWMLWDPRKQTLHDKACNTVVVET